MEQAHVVLIDKIVIKFTASLKKVIEKFSDSCWERRGEKQEDWISTKDMPDFFFLLLLFNILPLLSI